MRVRQHRRMAHGPFTWVHRVFWTSAGVTSICFAGAALRLPPLLTGLLGTPALLMSLAAALAGWSLATPGPPDEKRGGQWLWTRLHRLRLPRWTVADVTPVAVELIDLFGRRRLLPASDLTGATVVEQHGATVVEWHFSNGRRLPAAARGYHATRDWLELLALPPGRGWRTYRTPYRSPYRTSFWLAPFAMLAGILLGNALGLTLWPERAERAQALSLGLAGVLLLVPTWLLRMKQMAIGDDGILWETAIGWRFVPYEEIVYADASPGTLILGLTGDRKVVVPCPGLSGPITAEIAEALSERHTGAISVTA